MKNIEIKTYESLNKAIDDITGDLRNLDIELENLDIQFDLQLDWIDSILRNKAIKENDLINYNGLISINFKNCNFKKLYCRNIFENQILEVTINNGSIEELNLLNNKISGKFYINKQYGDNNNKIIIGKLVIKDTVFKENFKLHNAEVNEFTIEDTDFEKHADFFMSVFKQGKIKKNKEGIIEEDDICFKAINFKGLALFGDTEFNKKLIFKYVTFESFSHFRKSKLFKGLDLDYSNIQKEMNFFDVEKLDTIESKDNTSQETYRIIKHNFDKIGNTIEANKYHALELEKKKRKLSEKPNDNLLDYLVFQIHYLSSKHSTDWLLTLLWIVNIGIFSSIILLEPSFVFTYIPSLLFLYFSKKIKYTKTTLVILMVGFFYVLFTIENKISIGDVLNQMSLFNLSHNTFTFLGNYNEDKFSIYQSIIMFINKVLLGYLYYQFLISIRKDTKK